MEKMTKDEMILFLKGMNHRIKTLEEEKRRLIGSVETLEEAISRNNFARHDDGSGITTPGFSPDKILRILLNSQRDIEEETKAMVVHMREIYEKEDQIRYIYRCLWQMDMSDQRLIRDAYFNDVVIEQLASVFSLSKSQVYRKLQRAVDHLVEKYNASCTETPSLRAQRLIQDVIPYMPEGSLA